MSTHAEKLYTCLFLFVFLPDIEEFCLCRSYLGVRPRRAYGMCHREREAQKKSTEGGADEGVLISGNGKIWPGVGGLVGLSLVFETSEVLTADSGIYDWFFLH